MQRRPLVRDDDVVVFACRDAADRDRRNCQPLPEAMPIIDRDRVRQLGAAAAAREAVDDPRPNGLTGDELTVTLRTAIASGRAVGLQLAIYNPDFDPTGSNGRALASTVRNALLP
jgi:arginase